MAMTNDDDDNMLDAFPERSGRPFMRELFGGPWLPQNREKDLLAVMEVMRNEYGDHVNYVVSNDGRQPRSIEGQFPINHLPSWIGSLASVYASAPWRTFRYQGADRPPDGADVEAIEALYRDGAIDARLALANRYMEATGNALALVGWSERRNCPVIRLWDGGSIRVQTEPGDPQSPVRIVLKTGSDAVQDWRWNGSRFTLGGEDQALPDPFVHFFREMPNQDYFVPGIGLQLGTLAIALISDAYNALGEVVIHQAFSIWLYYGNAPADGGIRIGPRSVHQFPPKADGVGEGIEAVTPDPRITEVLDVLEYLKRAAQESCGIPATLWDAADDASGQQTVESRAPLLEYRKARSQMFHEPETQLLRRMLALAVRNGRIPGELIRNPEDWEVAVSFVDPATEEVMEEEVTDDGNGNSNNGAGNPAGGDESGAGEAPTGE